MNDTIHVREATESDLDAMVRLNAEVQNLHARAMPWPFKMADLEAIKAAFANWFADKQHTIAVACDDEQAVGYLMMRVREVPEHAFCFEQRLLYIDQIGVARQYHRQGIGRKLIAFAQTIARKKNIDRVELDVWDFNKNARGFFLSQGFQPTRHFMALTV